MYICIILHSNKVLVIFLDSNQRGRIWASLILLHKVHHQNQALYDDDLKSSSSDVVFEREPIRISNEVYGNNGAYLLQSIHKSRDPKTLKASHMNLDMVKKKPPKLKFHAKIVGSQ